MLINSLPIWLALGMVVPSLQGQAPRLTYFGRASVKIISRDRSVIYIDPFAPGDYSDKADLVLVTHGHADHNQVSLVTLKPGGEVVAPAGAVKAISCRSVKEGDAFDVGAMHVKVVPAYNANHKREASVGYVLTVDGVTIYHAGDTSLIPEMSVLAPLAIDYALLPTDGFWNMGGEEARHCADLVRSHSVIAIHSSPKGVYDAENASKLKGADVIPLEPGQTLALTSADRKPGP